jgi:hypothetical protein
VVRVEKLEARREAIELIHSRWLKKFETRSQLSKGKAQLTRPCHIDITSSINDGTNAGYAVPCAM